MARDETPPWGRGQTQYNGNTIDAANLGGTNYEGKEWRFEDTTYGTNQYVTVRAVRSTAPFNLLGARVCSFDPAWPMNRINGYTNLVNEVGAVLDEFLPPGGMVPNDVAFVVMEGPCLVLSPLDGGADNVINFMDPLVTIAGATTGAPTAGRVATGGTGGGTPTRDAVLNVIGRAIAQKTTANTNALVLIQATRIF